MPLKRLWRLFCLSAKLDCHARLRQARNDTGLNCLFRQPENKKRCHCETTVSLQADCVIARRQLAVSGLPLTDMSPRAVRRGGLAVQIVAIQLMTQSLTQSRKAL